MSNAKGQVNVTSTIELLGSKANQADIIARVNQIIERVNSIKVRDRGPKSERAMTDEDAFRVKFGDLKDTSHKDAAAELGLSYGQIYSARNSYTFNHVTEKDAPETTQEA